MKQSNHRKDSNWKGILTLAIVTVLSFGVVFAAKALSKDENNSSTTNPGDSNQTSAIKEALDISGWDSGAFGVSKVEVLKTNDKVSGYLVEVASKGYAGDVKMSVQFNDAIDKVEAISILSHSETEGIGSKVTEGSFLNQFYDTKLPVYLKGMQITPPAAGQAGETAAAPTTVPTVLPTVSPAVPKTLLDGTYHAEGKEFVNGYKDILDMEVKDGKIVALTWDNISESGDYKRKLSLEGSYTMTETGPRWDEQADALARYVIENQSVDSILMNEEGKTDTVSSVSIGVSGFVSMVKDCLEQASGSKVLLNDGSYHAEAKEFTNGYKDIIDMEVKNGKIVSLTWDNISDKGDYKRKLSMAGEYVMTENGPRWDEQADALAAYVLENQSVNSIVMNEEGKTDTVSSVSIGVAGFVSLVEDCIEQATGRRAILQDGVYHVEGNDFYDGYKNILDMTVSDGKITALTWDNISESGEYKRQLSLNGEYTMTETGPRWDEQADALAAYVLEHQSPEGILMNEEGKTDSVASVSISVAGFVSMVEEGLKQASEKKVVLKDGTYTAEGSEFYNGYKDMMSMEIKNGTIVGVDWNNISETGELKRKLSMDGEYVMTEDGLRWDQQADALAAYILQHQNADGIVMNEEGKTDSIAGVSISVAGFVSMIEKCLAQAAGLPMKDETTVTPTITPDKEEESVGPDLSAAGTQVDAVSNATYSSKAVINGINNAYFILREYVIKK